MPRQGHAADLAGVEPPAAAARHMRASVSAGSLGGGQPAPGRAAKPSAAEREGLSAWGGGEAGSCGDSPYLQKLPPVLRRSVSGTTGPRHHTRTVYAGERERDGTPVAGSR